MAIDMERWNPPARYRRHFNFGKYHRAFLYLRRTFSNIFLTLTDLRHRVIVCRTSGNSGVFGQKRKKRNALSLEKIVKSMMVYLKMYDLTIVGLITRMRLNRYYYCLKKEFRIMAL